VSYQGPHFGTAAAGTGWTNPTNVLADDDARATFNLATQADLKVTGFGLSIPAVATIVGIEVRHRGQGSSATAAQRQVRLGLTKDGTALAGTRKTACEYAQDADTDIASGGAADLWGTTWTPAEINAATFGVLLSDNDAVAAQLSIDSVEVVVHYTIAAFDSLATAVENKIQDVEARLSDPARDECIRDAILGRYSAARPRELVKEIAGDGSTYKWALTTANFPEWDDGKSVIKSLEYPADERDPEYLGKDDWTIARIAASRELRLLTITPASGYTLRIVYTALHDDDGSTVPASDLPGLANLAASLAARRLQAIYSQDTSPAIGADAVDHRSKQSIYDALAKSLMKEFENAFGLDLEQQQAPGMAMTDWTEGMADGGTRLTH
jgi:hypothetical protein